MIICHSKKFAFSRTPGCFDFAVEMFLRENILQEGDVATSMPYFELNALGENEHNLSALATAREIKDALGDDYKVMVVERSPHDAIYSEYLWKEKIGIFKGDLQKFVSDSAYKFKSNTDGADYVLDASAIEKELRAFLKEFDTDYVMPSRLKIKEFNNVDGIADELPDAKSAYGESLYRLVSSMFGIQEEEESEEATHFVEDTLGGDDPVEFAVTNSDEDDGAIADDGGAVDDGDLSFQ